MTKVKQYISNRYPLLLIILFSFLFSMMCTNTIWHQESTYVDSSVFIYVARIILKGGMPYLNVFDHKGPVIFLINAFALLISKKNGLYIVEFLNIFITFYFMYKIAKIKANKNISLITLLIVSASLFKYFEGGNYTEEFALPFITISLYFFIDYFFNNKINNFRLFICGLSFGTVFLLRPNMVVLWTVMCIGVLIKNIIEKTPKNLYKFILLFISGLISITIPILIWLIKNNAFNDFISDYFIFNEKYSSYLGIAVMTNKRIKTIFHFLKDPFILFSIIINIYMIKKDKKFFDKLYISYLITNLIFISLSGRQYGHYAMIIIPSLIYPYNYLILKISNLKRKKLSNFILLGLVIVLGLPNYVNASKKAINDYKMQGVNVVHINGEIVINDYCHKFAYLLKQYVKKDDKILLSGYQNIIYNLTDTYAPTKYSYQPPNFIYPEKNEEFYKEIKINKPKIIVLSSNYHDYDRLKTFIDNNDYIEIFHYGKNYVYKKNT